MKELIYIVTWCLTSMTISPTLLSTAERYDEFGREIFNPMVLKRSYDCNHAETFTDRDSAMAFYERARNEVSGYNGLFDEEGVVNVELDSMDLGLYELLRDIRSEQEYHFSIIDTILNTL